MPRRSRSREVALQLLYEGDLNPQRSERVSATFLQERLHGDESLIQFTRELVEGVQLHLNELDQLISKYSQNWTITRIAVTDRNVLRLGAYELIHTDTPGPVVLDEAIEFGAIAVIQPGGSIRDEEVIETANNAGLSMVFTGYRHFKH